MANEKRLIEIKLTEKELKNITHGIHMIIDRCCEYHEEEPYWMLIEKLENANKVDAVEVVRCKDCAVPHNKWPGCPKLRGLVPPPDFYCAFGERRE